MSLNKQLAVVLALLLSVISMGNAELSAARETVIPAGTILRVRLDNGVGSDLSRVEDTVRGHLASPIVIDGRRIVPADSIVTGSVTQAARSGKVKGRARLGMRFQTLVPRGDDARY